jgi:glycosyltransferase involved in cell wall biosynthesis
MVVTPSETVRKQAIERFRLRPDRVVAVPEAAAPWFGPVEPKAPGGAPYFLFVGTLEPRKNLPALLEAWREVRQSCPVDLVIAGRKRADCPELAAMNPEPGLRWIGEAPDAALPELYSGALALVYPSLYEGFGLPVLEAMQCGACVIASRAVEETAGGAAIYAGDARELAQAMRVLCQNPERVAELRAKSLARAREFTWECTARATYEVYREARRRFAE